MNLDDLAAFAAVAEARSFRGAAYARGVAASSLSDAVRRLERELDVRLLHRTTRSVTPTDAGQRLLERLTSALREVQGALDAIWSCWWWRPTTASCPRPASTWRSSNGSASRGRCWP